MIPINRIWINTKQAFSDRRRRLELLTGLVLLLIMAGAASARVMDPLEWLFIDLRFTLKPAVPFPSGITVVGIDEASLDVFGRWPWPREKHAALLGVLKHEAFRPAFIGYDVLFENRSAEDGAGDDPLVHHTRDFGAPVVMSYFFEKGTVSHYEKDLEKEKHLERFALATLPNLNLQIDSADKVSLPFDELTEVAHLAFVNTPVDRDGRTRRAQLVMEYQGKLYPSLDLLASLEYLGASPQDVTVSPGVIRIEKEGKLLREIPVNKKGEILINYYGEKSQPVSRSFVQVLENGKAWRNGEKPGILPGFKGQTVLVGVTALGIGDRRVTPYHQYEAGVFLHAQTIANILDERYLVRAPYRFSILAVVVTGLAAIFFTMFWNVAKALPAVVALGAGYFMVAYLLFCNGIWIDVAVQGVALAVLFTGITSLRYFTALEELKRTQAQLIQSAKMASLGQLSAGIVHEFRNILNAINLHIEFCTLPGTPPEKVGKYLEIVKGVMKNANEILNGLLTFARKSESVRKPGDLGKTVQSTLLLIQKEMDRHQIEIKTEFEEIPEVSYDAGQISQVIMNLMNNSRDAFKDRKEKAITLRVKNHSGGVMLDIEDNGCGIPPEILKRLFEPFVTSKPAGKGTGLGLSVCHGIIRNHGGEIRVTTAVNQGTAWHIFFPLA